MNLIIILVSLIFIFQQRDFWEDGLPNSLPIVSEQSPENGVSAPDFDGTQIVQKIIGDQLNCTLWR
jgi:hypothetical protein